MKTQKKLGTTAGLLAAAAFTGLIAGSANHASASSISCSPRAASVVARPGTMARGLDSVVGRNDCKGQNACKGQGGCKTSSNSCKGQNACKGQGGCKTASTAPSL